MKIKTDFVTNSSSTSFVVMTKEEFNLPQFLHLVGADNDTMFHDVFHSLFSSFKRDLTPISDYMKSIGCESIEEFSKSHFLSPNTSNRIKKAIEDGLKVYVGELHSDNGEIEGYFCCDSFLIEGDTIVIDATCYEW